MLGEKTNLVYECVFATLNTSTPTSHDAQVVAIVHGKHHELERAFTFNALLSAGGGLLSESHWGTCKMTFFSCHHHRNPPFLSTRYTDLSVSLFNTTDNCHNVPTPHEKHWHRRCTWQQAVEVRLPMTGSWQGSPVTPHSLHHSNDDCSRWCVTSRRQEPSNKLLTAAEQWTSTPCCRTIECGNKSVIGTQTCTVKLDKGSTWTVLAIRRPKHFN